MLPSQPPCAHPENVDENDHGIGGKNLGRFLAKDFRQIFGSTHDETAERLSSLARSALECLGRSDALYHNLEHTFLVTMVGRDILQGFSLSHRIDPSDYSHLICACLLHDIGYVRGILSGDTETEFVIDQNETESRCLAVRQMRH